LTLSDGPAFAKQEVIKVKLSEATFPLLQPERADWVRLEVNDNNIKLMHTTQVLDWFWGVYNWHDHSPTKTVFIPEGCQVSLTFSPSLVQKLKLIDSIKDRPENYASLRQGIIDTFMTTEMSLDNRITELKEAYDGGFVKEEEYQKLKSLALDKFTAAQDAKCSISGVDVLVLPEGADIRKGTITINYVESGQPKSVTFKVPPAN